MKKKPNVILIMADQWRGDFLGYTGHQFVETPYLNDLARKGITFNSAYSPVPTCIPARANLFTGMTQENTGRVGYQDGVDWKYPNYLAGEFSKNNYQTQAIGKMHVYPSRFRAGFDNVILHDGFLHSQRRLNQTVSETADFVDDYVAWAKRELGNRFDIMDMGLECNSFVAHPWIYPEYTHPTNWVAEMARDFFRSKDPTVPYFLYLSFHRPHAPYDPPQSYLNIYENKELPEPPVGDFAKPDPDGDGWFVETQVGIVQHDAMIRARKAYSAAVTHIDHQIGRIISHLVDTGEADNTIIVFTSDHGDLLGDHNLWRKSSPLEGSSRVPLIIYDPTGKLQYKPGTISDELVSLWDIMPTLLDLTDIAIPETVDGKSIVKLLNDEIKSYEYIHGEHSHGNRSYHMIRTQDKWKYSWFDQTGEEWLFNLAEDPEELNNLVYVTEQEDADSVLNKKLTELRNILIEELKNREEGYVVDGKLQLGRPILTSLKDSYIRGNKHYYTE